MRLHLDHNAGTPVDPRVLDRFLEVERAHPGNPASLHGSGRAARAVVEEARSTVACLIGAGDDEVVFVSGGTEANNLVVRGLGDPGRPVLASEAEHPSVLGATAARGRRPLPLDERGIVRAANPLPADVGLLALVHGQSEVGTVQPIAEAAQWARALDAPLHVDAAQTLGRLPLVELVGCADSVSFSTHKVGGLRGCSVLWVRGGAERLQPLLRGGGQEHGLRPGTVNPALTAATALAFATAWTEPPARAAAMARARDAFLEGLRGPPHVVLTPPDGLPNTAMVRFPGLEGRVLLPALDMAGVEASQGSACSSGSPRPPAVLRAMGLDDGAARQCVRFSFGHRHSAADGTRAAAIVAEVVERLGTR